METMMIVFLAIIFVVLLKISGKSRKAKFIDGLDGPPAVPILGNCHQFMGINASARIRRVLELDNIYGPLYRTWIGFRPYVHITNIKLAEVILKLKNVREEHQTFLYSEPCSTLFSKRNKSLWAGKNSKNILNVSHVGFVENLRQNEYFDILPWLKLTALDSICGKALDTKINVPMFAQALNEISQICIQRNDNFWLQKNWIWNFSKLGKREKLALQTIRKLIMPVIRERKIIRHVKLEAEEKSNYGRSLLDDYLDECEKNGIFADDRIICDEIIQFFLKGHAAITSILSTTILMLGVQLSIQKDVFREQKKILGPDFSKNFSIPDFSRMKFLDQVIQETLRLYPVNPFTCWTILEDIKLGDFTIPEGCGAILSWVSILRDPEHFQDPDHFEPGRFLPKIRGNSSYLNLPFSDNTFEGEDLILLEAKTILSYIVRNFIIESFKDISRSFQGQGQKIRSYPVSPPSLMVRLRSRT